MAAGLALTGALATTQSATATDIATLRDRAQVIADEVSGLEHRLAGLRDRRSVLDDRIVATTQQIGLQELEIRDFERKRAAAIDRYVERAREAYMTGPSMRIALILSAQSVDDMFALAEAQQEVAALDAGALEELRVSVAAAEAAQDRLDRRKQQLIADQAKIKAVESNMSAAIADRRTTLESLNPQIEELEREARALAAVTANPDQSFLELLTPSGPSSGIPKGFAGTGVTFEGIASWYGPGFEGNHTASGDIFDSDLFTAASKELPLGTWLYVEHQGRGVVVLVNDRGPYIDGRILDLSRAAAFEIGITGLGWIEAEIILKI